ncbi:hypothetical protein H634G_04725 [Metarhizium anisopliae BRIP 53293]|uniref:Calcium channel YVC1-like C-terminal transmembrane domain-containing protein n=1 Tax=Metarhizium anisopliae BRIP 53293 TaxID=1291518 RepID=A0A0D9P2Z2_METAN|nr:hypothetical protein H634G_04725 [Metarhizium anisopliae BRIP 53293]KJK95272.1 hypothetical protein H633G_00871 [Metarhizium anisopliae BRIP 53284]
MPIRLRMRPQPVRDLSPMSARYDFDMPDIAEDDSFRDVVKKLSLYFTDVIELPSTFEQLRTTEAGNCVRVLVDHLGQNCTNPAIVNALLALKWHYAAANEHLSLRETRSFACEITAWRFLTRLSERQAVDFCLYEIPVAAEHEHHSQPASHDQEAGETSPLLIRRNSSGEGLPAIVVGSARERTKMLSSLSRLTHLGDESDDEADPTSAFKSLNALEIAAIANAKRFLSQHVVQKIITGIWNGDIVFWDTLSVNSVKKPRYYNPHTSDPFSRLRVPKYLKTWEVLFFVVFLCLYYSVLITRDDTRITLTEVFLFIWIAAFFYDELSEWIDAGSIFYATDIWNAFDMIMILIGFLFAGLRVIGLAKHNAAMNEMAFNVLSLEALFMMPRICSILSLSPYWGTLIPCLKEMGKDFVKFMVLVVIVYFGFLTTFSLVGRDTFSFGRMTGILTKIFFGSSYVGFDIMDQIDPIFGPPLMIIFITLTSILLQGSLTGMLSNSFSRVITQAREEYLYVYSVYVLEASTSNRLTHFYPPFNLIALVIFRPLRFILPRVGKFRAGRIVLLRATHLPIVGAIRLYEYIRRDSQDNDEYAGFRGPRESKKSSRPTVHKRSSSGYIRQQVSLSQESTLLKADGKRRDGDGDDMEEPKGVEGQVAELHQKIDQLTSLVIAMQTKSAGDDTPHAGT